MSGDADTVIEVQNMQMFSSKNATQWIFVIENFT